MKRTTVHHGKRLLLAVLLGVFLMSPASSFAQPATIAVRGKIASLTGQELIVSSAIDVDKSELDGYGRYHPEKRHATRIADQQHSH